MARGDANIVVQSSTGAAQANKALTFYEFDGTTPLAQSFYDAPSGGSSIASPSTNSTGEFIGYASGAPQRIQFAIAGIAGKEKGQILPDPADILYHGRAVASTMTGALTISTAAANVYAYNGQHTASGTTGNKIMKLLDDSSNTVFEVASLGSSSQIATYVNSGVGPLVVSNVRNWTTGADMFVAITKLTGSVSGSHQATQFTYQTCAQPSDGFGGVTNIPDNVVGNFDYFAQNIASGASQNHDGSGRAIEIQTIVYANTGQRTMAAATIGCHTAVIKTSYTDRYLATGANGGFTTENGDCGIIIRNDNQSYTGFGTNRMGNSAILIAGALGWKQAIAVRNTTDVTIWAVDQNGVTWSNDIYPVPGVSGNIGTASRVWTTAHIGTVVANNGTAANPTVALLGAGSSNDGLFGVVGAGVVGITTAGTEKMRADTTGILLSAGLRAAGASVISPSLTGSVNDWNPTGLSTAHTIRLASDGAYNITGITAQAAGTLLRIINLSAFTITLKHQSGSSSAGNKINGKGAADIVVVTLDAVNLMYDSGSTAWIKASG